MYLSRIALHCVPLLFAALGLLSSNLPARADTDSMRISGSTTLLPVLRALSADFRPARTVPLDLQGGGSGQGIEALLRGETDIAASSRFIKPGEIERFQRAGVYPVPFRVAYDAIIPIVHKSNRLKSLSLAQLRQIFRGEVDNWREIGGVDRPIKVVMRDADSGTFQVWQERVAGGDSIPAAAFRADSTSAVVRHVAEHKGAIGYIGLASLNASIRPLR